MKDETLRQLYDLVEWGTTSTNGLSLRVLFLRTPEAKERLRPALVPGNVEKTMAAPVIAIIAYDELFYERLPVLFPHNRGMRNFFASSPALSHLTAFRNGTLQGAYLIFAARALGLDCGPLSGFDNAKVDAEFFPAPSAGDGAGGATPASRIKSNFICNLGYHDRVSASGRRLAEHAMGASR